MDKDQAKIELERLLAEGEADIGAGRTYTLEEVRAHVAELLAPKNTIYLTGDTHGQFKRVIEFCQRQDVQPESTFIILGDAGLNFYLNGRDNKTKAKLSAIPTTFFCIHGNHEKRPCPEMGYELSSYHGGQVWVQPQYPNIVFAIDGEIYDFMGYSCLVIGGAYSVDKFYRLARGYSWWPDEQPSDEIKSKVERVLTERNWKVDIVLSHTCPFRYQPTEAFLPGLDQSTIDDSTEKWLGTIEERLSYERWYCGHFHIAKKIDKLQFMFEDYALLPHCLNIDEEKASHAKLMRQAEIVQALGLLGDEEESPDGSD